jgi:hypothetical protein
MSVMERHGNKSVTCQEGRSVDEFVGIRHRLQVTDFKTVTCTRHVLLTISEYHSSEVLCHRLTSDTEVDDHPVNQSTTLCLLNFNTS